MLPKIHSATYPIILPSNNKKISIRSMSIGEEKELLIAQQMKDPDIILKTIKEVMKKCIIEKIDLEHIPAIDFEYIYVMIFTKSSSCGEVVDFTITYDKCPRGGTCKKNMKLNLGSIKIHNNENHNKIIKLSDEYSLEMKYPSIDVIDQLKGTDNRTLDSFDNMVTIMAKSIKLIFSNTDDGEVYSADTMPLNELEKFILDLDQEKIKKMSEFFETMPYLHYKNEFKCPECGEGVKIEFKGIMDFFQLQ